MYRHTVKNHPLALFSLLLGIAFSLSASAREIPDHNSFSVLNKLLSVDNMPLKAKTLKTETYDGYTKESIIFDGFDQEPVQAFFARPKGIAHPPVVILFHGIAQSRHQWWAEQGPYSFPGAHRQALLKNGFAVLAFDARNHGDRIGEHNFKNPYEYVSKFYLSGQRDMIFDTAKDARRAIDYLTTRKDVDSKRIGVMGFSLGAMISWVVAATDDRVNTMVSMASPVQVNQASDHWDIYSPMQFTPGLSNKSVLIIAAEEDPWYSKNLVNTLFEATPGPNKELKYFPGGHDLPISTVATSIAWIKRNL